MKAFKYFFKIERKRLVHIITISAAVSFFILAMYFVAVGAGRHRDVLDKKETFKRVEQSKVSRHKTYDRYGTYGFRIIFVPSAVNIFFYDSGAFSELSSTLDVGERLNVDGSFLGPNMYRERRVMYADFSGLHLLFGSLMALVFGVLTFRYREYLEELGSMAGFNKVHFQILSARFLLLALYFIIVTAAGIALVFLMGVPLTGTDLLYIVGFLGLWLLAVLVLFSAGALIGVIKAGGIAGAVLMAAWICLFYLIPLVVNQRADVAAHKIKSIYQQEKEKWDVLMNFEDRASEEAGKFKPELAKTPMEQELIESYMNKEYKQMQGLEKDMETKMRDSLKEYEWWSLASPVSFLAAAATEMSSEGYKDLVGFYANSQVRKDQFCRFYKDKKYYSRDGEKGVESFIKGEENIYYGRAQLPANMPWGLLELLALSLALQGLCYYCHKKALKKVDGDMAAQWDPASLTADAPEGKPRAMQIQEEGYNQRLYNHLAQGRGRDFLYLCHAGQVPGDIRVGDFLDLSAALMGVSPDPPATSVPSREKRFEKLAKLEKFKVSMAVTELAERAGKTCYLFHDLTREMPAEAAVLLKKRMEELSSRGSWVVLLLRDQLLYDIGSEKSFGIREASGWLAQVEHWADVLNKS